MSKSRTYFLRLTIRSFYLALLVSVSLLSPAQPAKKTVTNTTKDVQDLDSFFAAVKTLCSKAPNDNEAKKLLADNLRNNKAFLKDWEIGLNDKDAQIWHVLNSFSKSPFVVDSSDKLKLICKLPFIKNDGKMPGSKGLLEIVPDPYLDVENDHDAIQAKPDATSKVIGKVKSGERYYYFDGSTAYSPATNKYVSGTYKDDSEGGINYYAIVLDAKTHKLGYVISNATWLSFPQVQLQYLNNQWKIAKIGYP